MLKVCFLIQLGLIAVTQGTFFETILKPFQPLIRLGAEEELSTNPDDIGFYLFPNPNELSDFDVLEYANLASISKTRFNSSKRNIILTHGFIQNLTSDFPQVLIKDYLKAGFAETSNIIAVDWGKLSGVFSHVDLPLIGDLADLPLYVDVVKNVPIVGKRIQEFIAFLQDNNEMVGPDKFHLVGQSLGAHISGYAGMYYEQLKNVKLDRITGTDPAGPLFQLKPNDQRLDASDAVFVDVVHTNQGGFGFVGPLGDADFYVNGVGPVQPACALQPITNPFCSHNTAPHYFGMSILDPSSKFLASSNVIFRMNSVMFGEFCPRDAKGRYYINIDLPQSEVPSP